MLTINIQFPARQYHATPWGTHVNEGLVEWPPSPWRITRALLATGFTKLGWSHVDNLPEAGITLLQKLAGHIPSYQLPPATPAHIRHFMPAIEGKKESKNKIFDSFLRFDTDAPLLVCFPHLSLTPPERELLTTLLQHLSYLGRAESWVIASIHEAPVNQDQHNWCHPHPESTPVPNADIIPLLAPQPKPDYQQWRASTLRQYLEADEQRRQKKHTKKQRQKIEAMFPETILEALTSETADLQKNGWTQPPGSRWLHYTRPAQQLAPAPLLPPPHKSKSKTVTSALLALSSDTQSGKILPLCQRAVPQAELLHRALLSHMDKRQLNSSTLRGCDANGNPLRNHQHTHFIPLDLDQDNRIDHILLHAPAGFTTEDLTIIRSVRRTWSKGMDDDIVVTCVGAADLDLFQRDIRCKNGRPADVFGTAKNWHSSTPFIMPRHIKKKKHTPEDQVRTEFQTRNWPQPESITFWNKNQIVKHGFLNYVRTRSKESDKPQPPSTHAWGITLTFANAFDATEYGPLCIGYGSHWGLGVFQAESEPPSHNQSPSPAAAL